MGGLSKIYLHGSPSTIATCLRDTFSSAASYPAQHNQLHLSLAGTWPPKNNLARLAFALGTHAALSGVDESALSEEDMQIIGDVFGKGRELTKLRSRFEKQERT